jgi:hypothetical protein
MSTLRCTKKLLALVGVKPEPESNHDVGSDDWHANLVWVERKKLVLFCSNRTLFCCVSPPVLKAQIQSIVPLFLSSLGSQMQYEGFAENDIAHVIAKYESMGVGRTNNRSVVGSMNDYVFHLDYRIYTDGGLAACNLGEVVQFLNQIPQVGREFHNGIGAFKRSLIRGVA